MKILMVCLGNICRSPLAEGILKDKVEKEGLNVIVDSAGTSGHHSGENPDPRMRATAKKFGINIDRLKARKFCVQDFEDFDLIYTMDSENYRNVLSLSRNDIDKKKVMLILNEIHPDKNAPVPDPYFGGEKGFIEVYHLLDQATDKIIEKLKKDANR